MNRRLLYQVLGMCGLLFGVLCCGGPTSSNMRPVSDLREAWNFQNSPSNMDRNFIAEQKYIANFAALPLQGKLKTMPWSDDYWATKKGGISYRWNFPTRTLAERYGYTLPTPEELSLLDLAKLSPAEKYDLFTGHSDFPLVNAERRRTKVLKTVRGSSEYEPGFVIPAWEGLCHAWAPAALAFSEPQNITIDVTSGPLAGKAMPFGASDIKALLTYFLHAVDGESQYLGMRCNFSLRDLTQRLRSGQMSLEEFQAAKAACDDTNAGAFHIVLANQIGRIQEGFIMDVTREYEVWNHPIYGFESKVLSEHDNASEGAAPGTVKEVVVQTKVNYIVEVVPSWRRVVGAGKKERVYTYKLELDKNGNIIGGAWPEEQSDRPDFLWKQKIPEFGEAYAPLKLLYEKATAEDVRSSPQNSTPNPANPPNPPDPSNPPPTSPTRPFD